jgi:hypothetical protein
MRFVGLLIGQNLYKLENLAVAGLAVALAGLAVFAVAVAVAVAGLAVATAVVGLAVAVAVAGLAVAIEVAGLAVVIAGLRVAAAEPIATIPKKNTGNLGVNIREGVQKRPSKVYKRLFNYLSFSSGVRRGAAEQVAKSRGYWGVADEEQGLEGPRKAIRRLEKS